MKSLLSLLREESNSSRYGIEQELFLLGEHMHNIESKIFYNLGKNHCFGTVYEISQSLFSCLCGYP